MPPGPLYNWLCVLHSASEILAHAASIRASQLAEVNAAVSNQIRRTSRERIGKQSVTVEQEWTNRRKNAEIAAEDQRLTTDVSRGVGVTENVYAERNNGGPEVSFMDEALIRGSPPSELERRPTLPTSDTVPNLHADTSIAPSASTPFNSVSLDAPTVQLKLPSDLPLPSELDKSDIIAKNVSLHTYFPSVTNSTSQGDSATGVQPIPAPTAPNPRRNLQASRVPSSRLGRLFHYGGLAASLGYGAASEALRRVSSPNSDGTQTSLMMSSANVSRLVDKLSMMRGAALKLGQFMSIQGMVVLVCVIPQRNRIRCTSL